MQSFTVQITAGVVGWYGAIVATLSLVISGISVFRDRAKIKIKFNKNMWIMGTPNLYDEDKTYNNIVVINSGRRTIVIGNVGIVAFVGGSWLLGDGFASHKNKILNEQHPTVDFFVPENDIDLSKAHYISVYDQTGREYRKYFSQLPTFRKLIYILKSWKLNK